MKTLEELQKQLDEIQYQIDKLKKSDNDDFDIIDHYHIEEWNSPIVKDDMGKELFSGCKNFNGFEIQKDAERMLKNINARAAMFHIAKHLNDGWEPDWKKVSERKFMIVHNARSGDLCIDVWHTENSGNHYFRTKALAEKALKLMESKNLLKDYFMIWED